MALRFTVELRPSDGHAARASENSMRQLASSQREPIQSTRRPSFVLAFHSVTSGTSFPCWSPIAFYKHRNFFIDVNCRLTAIEGQVRPSQMIYGLWSVSESPVSGFTFCSLAWPHGT